MEVAKSSNTCSSVTSAGGTDDRKARSKFWNEIYPKTDIEI